MIKEEVLNTEIGNILRKHLFGADIRIEENDQLEDVSQRPDLVIKQKNRTDVVVEHKIDNGRALTEQCQARLKSNFKGDSPVRVVIGLLSPSELQELTQPNKLKSRLIATNRFRWALFQEGYRFPPPAQSWLTGSLEEFASFVDRTGATGLNIDNIINEIKDFLRFQADRLGEDEFNHFVIGRILKQEPSRQTTRMGLAIILNAVIFQAHIARQSLQVTGPAQLLNQDQTNTHNILAVWRSILEINYLPIFRLAYELVSSLNNPQIVDRMTKSSLELAVKISKESDSQGLIGTIFGELIKDRKLLASFYTLPEASMLVAELAVAKLGVDYSDKKTLASLKVADLAVGTGTLLVAVYRRIVERYLLSGKNPKEIHQQMIENVMIGCDVDPFAAHITAGRLSGEYPEIIYKKTNIYVMPFGLIKLNDSRQKYKIGSLDLLADRVAPSLFGEEEITAVESLEPRIPTIGLKNSVDIATESVDIVIMNPPFTRPTGQESDKKGVAVPSFAGLSKTEDEQRQMSDILKSHLKGLSKRYSPLASHGNAGLASNFMDLAHIKLRPG